MNIFRTLFNSLSSKTVAYTTRRMSVNSLYYSHEQLTNFIELAKNEDEGVLEYLKHVQRVPIQDFTPGLEWFNTSEPLSMKKHLQGKIVILDFFTYCCINCMHILPDLRELENKFSIEDGLVVVGVHSAKFENEKISSNILAAVQRYNISHPVVNDSNSDMWKNCGIHCWPTLLVVGPTGNPIVMLTGEGHKDNLILYIKNALKFYKEKNLISNHKLPIKSAYHLLPDLKGPLLFPGKITNILDENNHEILAVSDTGNNRILILKEDGTIIQQIGGNKLGFKDGSLEDAEFNNPQGLTFQNRDILFVADTENHAIRKVDLKNKKVETVAGIGKQGDDMVGGNKGLEQAISSPWDVSIYRKQDVDPVGNPIIREVLIIAMAGTHQIWALFLEDTVWWKSKKYTSGTCVNIVGSGREENRNNSYPHNAAFAQPSGLALCQNNKEIYIADSESSSIRRISLVDGKVTPVVGGERDPSNLFAFGDKDGTLFDAKLQHALGVGITSDEKTLFVTDTYNHKVKKVNVADNSVSSITLPTADATDGTSSTFKEPAGVCISSDNNKLYVADTNNHQIKVLHLNNQQNVTKVEKLELKKIENNKAEVDKSSYEILSRKPISINSNGGKIILTVNFKFDKGLGLTEGAPQTWLVDLPDITWSSIPKNGSNLELVETTISVPTNGIKQNQNIDFLFNLVTCTDDTCLPKSFIVRVPIVYQNSESKVTENISVLIKPENILLL
ncbi:NHL repeat-containing protein 2 [Diabrotica virgifera virgifera]|uniref:NHL repeat-containing protein 2 n=1 Tax=Diabrotica virgifera virgifera TaxID=50390 RepID=A0A6P7FU75_DIAVI|nr:NHL repeat-containing protein 2 [Diabrotica virgifera virgifera]